MTLFVNKDKKQQVVLELLTLVMVAFVCTLLGVVVTKSIAQLGGFSGNEIHSIVENLQPEDVTKRSWIKAVLLAGHLFTFVLPSLLFAFILHKTAAFNYFKLNRPPIIQNLLTGGVWILIALPFIMLFYWLNQQIAIGALQGLENQAGELTKKLLVMSNHWEFLFSLLVIAIVPAIGEELMFRGILQQVFGKMFNNGHAGVWLAAIIFSAIHLQFEGFLPRMFLGALLGYLFLWTQNLWVAIFAHFINNGVQLVAVYASNLSIDQQDLQLEKIWLPGLFSLVLMIGLGTFIYKFNQNQTDHQIENG